MPFPSRYTHPDYYRDVKIGGRRILASLVAVNGIRIEDDWNEQRATNMSGATYVFRGTKPAGPIRLTFVAVSQAELDDLREVYEMLAPKAGAAATPSGGTQGSAGSSAYGKQFYQAKSPSSPQVSTSSSAAALLAQAQAALAAAQSGAVDPTVAATPSTPVSVLTPGPKPPTLSIENGYANYVGITAVSRKTWEGPVPNATNGDEVTIELVPQRAPVKAGVGAASAKTQDNPGQKSLAASATQGPVSSAKAANAAAAQWMAG